MKKLSLLLLALAALFGLGQPAEALELGVRGYYWFPGLDGDLKVDAATVPGSIVDLQSDLGFDEECYSVVEAFCGFGRNRLELSYYQADYDGDTYLSRNITFNGENFTAGSRIRTSLEYDVYDFRDQYKLLELKNLLAGFSLGVIGRVKVFDGEVKIRSATLTSSRSFTAPVPMLGLRLHLGILPGLLEGRVLATAVDYWDGTAFDGQADISFTPFPFLHIHAGYRAFYLDVDADRVQFNYDTSGPYVALTVSF